MSFAKLVLAIYGARNTFLYRPLKIVSSARASLRLLSYSIIRLFLVGWSLLELVMCVCVVALRRGMGIGWGVAPSSCIRRLGHGPNLSKCLPILASKRVQNTQPLRFLWCRYLPRTPTNAARTPQHPTQTPYQQPRCALSV